MNLEQEEKNLEIVRLEGRNIKSIVNPSEAVKQAAVRQNGLAIYRIKKPSKTVQLAAVQQNLQAFLLIENPCKEVKALASIYSLEAMCGMMSLSFAMQISRKARAKK